MRAFGIFPTFDFSDPEHPRVRACIAHVTALVCQCLRAGGDRFHFTIDWRDPGTAAWGVYTEGLAEPHLVSLGNADDLMRLVRLSVDPFSGQSAGVIRSTATCRAVTFGFDGQAFLCLRHEDEPPTSPDTAMLVIEERADLLVETDYFDGEIVTT